MKINHKIKLKNSDLQTIPPYDFKSLESKLENNTLLKSDRKQICEIISNFELISNFVQQKMVEEFNKASGLLGASSERLPAYLFDNIEPTDAEKEALAIDAANDENCDNLPSTDGLDHEDTKGTTATNDEDEEKSLRPKKRKLNGEGASKTFTHSLSEQQSTCPCCQGKMHKTYTMSKTIVVSVPTLETEVHEIEQARCLECETKVTAAAPERLNQCIGRFHHSAIAALAAMRYQFGMPSLRLETFTSYVGLSIPDSTQWMIFELASNKLLKFYQFLAKEAAIGKVQHVDDTSALIIDLAKRIEQEKINALKDGRDPKKIRSGIHTTSLVSRLPDGDICFYSSGLHHAGEIVGKLLGNRDSSIADEVILMSDALSHNKSKLKTVDVVVNLALCNAHARRNFYELKDDFQKQIDWLLLMYAEVFKNDRKSKNMTPNERLVFHQNYSLPIMNDMKRKLSDDLDIHKVVEPNSRLGVAYKYFINHFDELCAFARFENAPVTNNLCERILKAAIRHRRNSLFFKNTLGALVADIFMSILITAHHNKVNPIQYLTDLLNYSEKVNLAPRDWLPWNYKNTVEALKLVGAQA